VRPVLPPGATLRYEPHALARMARRGITKAGVRATLEAPDDTRPAADRPPTERCTVCLRRIGSRTCKVYVRESSEPMLVATVARHGE